MRDRIPGAEHAGLHALSVQQGDNVVRVVNPFTGGAVKNKRRTGAAVGSPNSRARATVGIDASLQLRQA